MCAQPGLVPERCTSLHIGSRWSAGSRAAHLATRQEGQDVGDLSRV